MQLEFDLNPRHLTGRVDNFPRRVDVLDLVRFLESRRHRHDRLLEVERLGWSEGGERVAAQLEFDVR